MITRIVKLHFKVGKTNEFLVFFQTIKEKVNTFPGCLGMRLVLDLSDPQTIMTYSEWNNEEDLLCYRNSETFGEVWPKIKPWFDRKPEAWTLHTIFDGFQ